MKDYHCCATCIHYEIRKGAKDRFLCGRLGFATSPKYRFDCWTPKETVREKIRAGRDLAAQSPLGESD